MLRLNAVENLNAHGNAPAAGGGCCDKRFEWIGDPDDLVQKLTLRATVDQVKVTDMMPQRIVITMLTTGRSVVIQDRAIADQLGAMYAVKTLRVARQGVDVHAWQKRGKYQHCRSLQLVAKTGVAFELTYCPDGELNRLLLEVHENGQ